MLIKTRSAVHVALFQLMTLVEGQRSERVAEGIRAPLILGCLAAHLNLGKFGRRCRKSDCLLGWANGLELLVTLLDRNRDGRPGPNQILRSLSRYEVSGSHQAQTQNDRVQR